MVVAVRDDVVRGSGEGNLTVFTELESIKGGEKGGMRVVGKKSGKRTATAGLVIMTHLYNIVHEAKERRNKRT